MGMSNAMHGAITSQLREELSFLRGRNQELEYEVAELSRQCREAPSVFRVTQLENANDLLRASVRGLELRIEELERQLHVARTGRV